VLPFREIVDRVAGERWVRFWTVLGGIAGTLALLVSVIAVTLDKGRPTQPDAAAIATSPRRPQEPATTIPSTIPGSPPLASHSPGAPPTATPPTPSEPPALLEQQVNLDRYTGVDVDSRRARSPLKQGAAGVDLYLDWGYILYSSVLHSDMYDDTYQGGRAGVYDRCASYHQLGREAFAHKYIVAGMQLCITTSDGYPGWIQINSEPLDRPGSAILKVVVWKK
jgi:hypothetical protein